LFFDDDCLLTTNQVRLIGFLHVYMTSVMHTLRTRREQMLMPQLSAESMLKQLLQTQKTQSILPTLLPKMPRFEKSNRRASSMRKMSIQSVASGLEPIEEKKGA
jgi:hypothetical protein